MFRKKPALLLTLVLCVPTLANAFNISNSKWGDDTIGSSGGTVSFGFTTSGRCSSECSAVDLSSFMPSGFGEQIANAFKAWSSVANINFEMASNPDAADIKIAGDSRLSGNTLGYAFFPKTGDIFFNSNRTWSTAATGTSLSIFLVALHEIGHALGLEHENGVESIMNSIINPGLTGLTADDIAGIRALYGPRVGVGPVDPVAPVDPAAPVPLPAALWMMIAGLFALGPYFRRREA